MLVFPSHWRLALFIVLFFMQAAYKPYILIIWYIIFWCFTFIVCSWISRVNAIEISEECKQITFSIAIIDLLGKTPEAKYSKSNDSLISPGIFLSCYGCFRTQIFKTEPGMLACSVILFKCCRWMKTCILFVCFQAPKEMQRESWTLKTVAAGGGTCLTCVKLAILYPDSEQSMSIETT